MRRRLTVELFGNLRVLSERATITEKFRTRNGALLLARLASAGNRACTREEIGELLWPDTSPDIQRRRLRNEISLLRRDLGDDIIWSNGHYSIQLGELHQSDVATFDNALTRIRHTHSSREKIGLLREAAAQYKGEFLPGFYEDWVLLERVRLASDALAVYKELVQELLRSNHSEVMHWVNRCAALFPEDSEVQQLREAIGQAHPLPVAVPRTWPYVSEAEFGSPGSLIVASYDTGSLFLASAQGKPLGQWQAAQSLIRPWGIALGPDGSLYVACHGEDVVRKISRTGIEVTMFAALPPGSHPFGIAFDAAGRLFVCAGRTSLLHCFSPNGEPIATLGAGLLYHPRTVLVAPDGTLLVSNTFRGTVVRLSPEGQFLGIVAEESLALPHGIVVDSHGHLLIANVGTAEVRCLRPDGTSDTFAYVGECRPACLALDASGDVYVSCASTGVVRRFSALGEDKGEFIQDIPNPAGMVFRP